MLIGDKYKIESDTLNVTLYKREIKRDGSGYNWRGVAFFSTPQNALQFLVNEKITGTGMLDFETVCKKIDELNRLINELKDMPELLKSRRDGEK